MIRPSLLVAVLALFPGFAWAQGGLVAKHKYQARHSSLPTTRLESSDHSFSIAVPLGWILLTGDSKDAVATLEAVAKEPGTEDLVALVKSGKYQVFALNALDGLREKPVGEHLYVGLVPAPPDATANDFDGFKEAISVLTGTKDTVATRMDVHGVTAFRATHHLKEGDSDLDCVTYAFVHKDQMVWMTVAVAAGTLNLDRYDKAVRSIKFKD